MRIVLVDDHQLFRAGVRALLERDPEMTVVGEASDGRAALALLKTVPADVVVMDITMPLLNGVDATRLAIQQQPGIKIVALSMNADPAYVLAMLAAGARGYLLKNAQADELRRALRTVHDGATYLSPAVTDTVVAQAVRSSAALPMPATSTVDACPLTLREREVLQLVAEGHASKQIADQLHVSTSTIETHRRQIMDKLGLRSVAELTKYAVRLGLTSLGG